MRKYRNPILAVAALAMIVVLWRSCSAPQETGDSPSGESRTNDHRPDAGTPDRMERIRELVRMGNVNIRFLGRVVDQDGAPLEGVDVKYRVEVVTVKDVLNWTSTYDRGSATSGADGIFEIRGKKGLKIAVGPFAKTGYRNGQKNERAFSYFGSPELHDASKTVDFLMVREDIPQTKEIYGKRLSFAWNQGEVRIPLKSGLGDFILIPTRDMRGMENLPLGAQEDFDWNVKVFMERADLVDIRGDSSSLAPASGYRKMYEYGYRKSDPNWSRAAQTRYAFKTEDGQYGVIDFHLNANGNDFDSVNGSLKVRLNESGARNLD